MTYLVVNYETYKDGTATRKSIKDYESENEAIIQWHKELASARADKNCAHFLCMIETSTGGRIASETYDSEE